MKKILFTLALTVQVMMALAADNTNLLVQPRQENVKMFQQAGTSTPVLQVLTSGDRITFVRQHNKHWDLVNINGQSGYVLRSEIAVLKGKK
jgi:hypothetical protein